MDSLLKAIYILHLDGTPVLRVNLDESTEEKRSTFLDLFGGFSSAINVLVKELGHKELKSITVGDGVLVYSSKEPLLFVVHAVHPKNEQLAKLLVKQVEHEFLASYEDILVDGSVFVHADFFNPFEAKVIEIYDSLMRIYTDYPQLVDFLPSFIPLTRLNEVLNLGLDVIEGFPDDTIKLVRRLSKLFVDDEDLEAVVGRTLGKYSGWRIAHNRFHDEFVINQENVLELLNEISVSKYDMKEEVYDILLCPICRGRTAEKPMCHFFSGFIEGALDNPGVFVEQISCRALGEKSCRFKLRRS